MDLHNYIRSFNPVVFRDFWLGDTEDYSLNPSTGLPYNRAITTPNGNTNLVKGSKGYGAYVKGTGHLSIADGAEQRTATGSVFVFSSTPFDFSGVHFQGIVSKRNGAAGTVAVCWDFAISAANTLRLYDGNAPALSSITDTRLALPTYSVGVTWEIGERPLFYANGVELGLGSASMIGPFTATPPILVGNQYVFTPYLRHAQIQVVVQCNTRFSAAEAATLQQLWNDRRAIIPDRSLSKPPPYYSLPNEKLAVLGDVKSNSVVDRAQGLLLTRTGLQVEHGPPNNPNTPSGRWVKGHGGNRGEAALQVTDSSLDNLVPITFAGWLRIDGAQEANSGYIYCKGTNIFRLYYDSASNKLKILEQWSAGAANWETAASLFPTGVWVHFVIRHAATAGSTPTISINGASPVAMTELVASSGTKDSDTDVLTMLDRDTFTREFNGAFADFRVFNSLISEAEGQELYNRGALRVESVTPPGPVSLVPTASSPAELGPYRTIDGNLWEYNFDDDSRALDKRYLTAGQNSKYYGIKHRSMSGYGAVYYRQYYTGGTNFFGFMSDRPVISGANGYYALLSGVGLVSVNRITNGAGAGLWASIYSGILSNTWYEHFIVRSPVGFFRMWMRGGSFSTWQESNTMGTDTTYSFSNGFWGGHRAGDRIADVRRLPYFYGTPNDIPWLAD